MSRFFLLSENISWENVCETLVGNNKIVINYAEN